MNQHTFTLTANFIDIEAQRIYPAVIHIENGNIKEIQESNEATSGYILPGFIDSHVHVESSMLTPAEFAKLAVVHGTVATVSDPHEIANVLGIEGVDFMIRNGNTVPFKFNFGAPSCVPATAFETAGAVLGPTEVKELLQRPEVKYLAEMMNWPGVLYKDSDVYEKIKIAHDLGKPVDGHAPGLRGEQAREYISAGISTDHECFTAEEALDKLQHGMKILIREGSAAKNFEALADLLHEHSDMIMLCSDDKHPDELINSHIDDLVRRALARGIPLFNVLKAACINPVAHYKLDVGLLRPGDPADFIIIDHPDSFRVLKTYINGQLVAEQGKSFIQTSQEPALNQFAIGPISPEALRVKNEGPVLKVIETLDGQLITQAYTHVHGQEGEFVESNINSDVLKITVVNRYKAQAPAVAFIKNFGLKKGAIASSVAHDSHNIIAVGTDDASLARAVNLVIAQKGGISCTDGQQDSVLALPIAGLMTDEDGYIVAQKYAELDKKAKELGSTLRAPYMSLSFMALLVIPFLKLSDRGLFDGTKFEFTDLFEKGKDE
jgi:adenine deaminase